jgi:Domain of unknown function (DUF4105)
VIRSFVISVGLLTMPCSVHASEYVPRLPAELETTVISLLTIDEGSELYSRFGHTMLRFHDEANEIDFVVNWGEFDFSDPLFIFKFFRGNLDYKMGFAPTKNVIRNYRNIERRGIIEEDISLTLQQKHKLLDKILWNMRPENLHYPYQYFRNNCATIPRDYIDFAVGGMLQKDFGELIEPTITYRDYARQKLSVNSFVAWGIDVIFNGDTDVPLRAWDEMFYPKKLQEHLAEGLSFDDQGQHTAGQLLLTNRHVLVDLPAYEGNALDGYYLTWMVAGIPLLTVFVSILLRRMAGKRIALRWQNRAFGFVSLWWGLTAGFFGLTHIWSWVFSRHTDLFHNLNILLFWPIDFIVLVQGFRLGIFGGYAGNEVWFTRRFWAKFASAHLVTIPFYAAIGCSGLFDQNTISVVVFMVPLSLLYYFVMVSLTWQGDSVS